MDVNDDVKPHLGTRGADVGHVERVEPLAGLLGLEGPMDGGLLEGRHRRHEARNVEGRLVLLGELGRQEGVVLVNPLVIEPRDDHRVLQALALVNGQDAHRIGAGQDADARLGALAVPMGQETRPAEFHRRPVLGQFHERLGVGGVTRVQFQTAQDAADGLRQGQGRPGRPVKSGHHLLQQGRALKRAIPALRVAPVVPVIAVLLVVGLQQSCLIPIRAVGHLHRAPSLQEPQDGTGLFRLLHRFKEMDHRQRRRMASEGQALVGKGHDARGAGQEVFGQPLGFLVGPHEQGDVPRGKSVRQRLTDPLFHPFADQPEALLGPIGLHDFDLDPSRKRLACLLTNVGVDFRHLLPHALDQGGVNAVVEVHHLGRTAPVLFNGLDVLFVVHPARRIDQGLGQDFPLLHREARQGHQLAVVSIAPTVNGLFGIPHNQGELSVRQGLPHRHGQVAPLHDRGVLEFVDEDVGVSLPGPLEDVRGRTVCHHLSNHAVQGAQRAHVVVALDGLVGFAQRREGAHQRQPPRQHDLRPVQPAVFRGAHLALHRGQCRQPVVVGRDGGFSRRVVLLGPNALLQPGGQGFGRGVHPSNSKAWQPISRHPFPRESVRDAGPIQVLSEGHCRFHQGLPTAGHLCAHPVLDGDELGRRPPLQLFQQGEHLLLVNGPPDVEQLPADLGIPVVFHSLLHEPPEQLGQVLFVSNPFEHPVHGRLQQAPGVELHGEVVFELEVGGESPDQSTHEFVERHDGQLAIMPVQGGAQASRTAAEFGHLQSRFRLKTGRVIALLRGLGELLELLDDAVLHLLGRLVGEGEGEDAPEGQGIA